MKYQGKTRESDIERKFVKIVKSKGGLCLKFVSPNFNGVPDRLILFTGGRVAFVEFKRSGETLRPLQIYRKKQLEKLGFSVYCVDDLKKIGDVLDEIQGGDAE